MSISGDSSWLSLATQRMDWAAARQKVVAENVANADTPGYKGRDVVPFEEHLSRAAGHGRTAPDTQEMRSAWGGTMDGNEVVLEEQMALANEASSSYSLAGNLYRKGYSLMSIAIA